MIISLIKYSLVDSFIIGFIKAYPLRKLEPELYSAKQGDVIAVGKTRDEVIKTILEKL